MPDTKTRPATIGDLAAWAGETYGPLPALRFRSGDTWQDITYAELAARVRAVAGGLAAAGVREGDRVAILAETRPEWTVCDLAIAELGAVCVPVYPTNSAEECAWVIGDSGAVAVICEQAEHVDRVRGVRADLPDLRAILSIDPVDGVQAVADIRGEATPVEVDPDEPNTIVYTSGTTGPPKGCLLSHRNWRASLDAIQQRTTLAEGDTIYLYLPLAHLFARMVQLTSLECGATLVYFGGDIRAVVAELMEVQPTHLPSVPRLFEKAYGMVRTQVERAATTTEQAQDLVRAALGGRVREALTGAAPIAPEILEFFAGSGIPVYEAYGMTESTALISANTPGHVRFGSVGKPLPGVTVRIAADGEILAAGDNVFSGYHKNPSATAETLIDGWLHTGDLGHLDDDGYLHITGRKKDIIITAGGKNLTPANFENDLRQSPWIANAVMIGDRRPHPVALITLDPDEVARWAAENGVDDPHGHAEIRRIVTGLVAAANAKYAPPEQVRNFAILPADFSVADGELTPTLKLRRAVIQERHREVIESLYPPAEGAL
ncbi:AMP-dependent synthetase/ligase [Actinokineospora sp. HUAS TT18]|uniref:AMP-dependent synthetase/ligase n=1 Tax=Actinokineospora sp. HUAS TT18 TaxID=3447451 RepID=UPI003F51C0DE